MKATKAEMTNSRAKAMTVEEKRSIARVAEGGAWFPTSKKKIGGMFFHDAD
jgi:hypothetical protein